MKKILFISLVILLLFVTGCDVYSPAVIDDNPPIDVNVASGNVTMSGTISGNVNVVNIPTVHFNNTSINTTTNGTVTVGSITGVTVIDTGIPAIPYYYLIADGSIAGHTAWSKIGFNPSMVANVEADAWSSNGTYVFPVAAAGMEVRSSDNTKDIGTSIFSGTSNGGNTTSLTDTTKNFLGGTPVAIGDCVILDKSGTVPEYGYVTAITATVLTVSGGFSYGGTGSTRLYTVIDKSAYTGAHAVEATYLDGSYNQKREIIVLNGTTVIPTVNLNLFRINAFRLIVAGTDNKPTGNLEIRNLANTPRYSYITAGYTRARNIAYTVPAGKTLYVTSATFSYGYAHNSTHFCRIYTRANIDPSTGFQTDGIFYPFTEVICSNSCIVREFEVPTKLPAKTDIKVSAIADYAGVLDVTLRGWLE